MGGYTNETIMKRAFDSGHCPRISSLSQVNLIFTNETINKNWQFVYIVLHIQTQQNTNIIINLLV